MPKQKTVLNVYRNDVFVTELDICSFAACKRFIKNDPSVRIGTHMGEWSRISGGEMGEADRPGNFYWQYGTTVGVYYTFRPITK